MKITHVIPRSQRGPSFAKRIMVDTVRGVMRVRKWPRKRGTPTSAAQLFWIDWFRQANFLAKYVDAATARAAIELTRGSRWYPRDIILKAMRGRLLWFVDQDGWKWFPMAAIQDISDSLDVLGQTVGDILVRAADRWRPPVPGNLNDVMTNKGPGNPPAWAPTAGSGGVTQAELAESPIVPDGTKNFYDVDITNYVSVIITFEAIGMLASGNIALRYSIDGGVTFKAGAADYWAFVLNNVIFNAVNFNNMGLGNTGAAAGHNGFARLDNLRAGRATYESAVAHTGPNGAYRSGNAHFNGPITHVKIYTVSGTNFSAGTIRLVGFVKA